MTNIEQIKKDWEQHCEEYGFKVIIQNIDNHLWKAKRLHINESTDEQVKDEVTSYSMTSIAIDLNSNHIGYIDSLDSKYYKLFTSFYEKLMQENDNEY